MLNLHYSPYYNGSAYVNFSQLSLQGMLGEALESTAGLLSRLELLAGYSYPDADYAHQRIRAYFQVLKQHLSKESILYPSLEVDIQEVDKLDADAHYRVTEELLQWRDTLILAKWDKKTELPGKLNHLAQVEKHVTEESPIRFGVADRWLQLKEVVKDLKDRVKITVHCPKELVSPLIQQVLEELGNTVYEERLNTTSKEITLNTDKCQVLQFKELTQAFEWLSTQETKANQLVVCQDTTRLDSVLRAFSKPTVGEAGSPHITDDLRNQLHTPESIIWLDCNGDYGYHYPYYFMTVEEKAGFKPYEIPAPETLLNIVNFHLVTLLNTTKEVLLVSAKYDNGNALIQHPFVAMMHQSAKDHFQDGEVNLKLSYPQEQRELKSQAYYYLPESPLVKDATMSYSTLEKLIHHPFDFVAEKQLSLYEPKGENDLTTVEGLVAHAVVELMIKAKGHIDLDNFEEYFQQALEEEGELMQKPEYVFNLQEYRLELKQSLKVLHEIITEQHLTPVEAEMKLECALDIYGPSKAFIDLVLQNENQEYILFDFKYSKSNTYPDKLEENASTQFEFYKQMFLKSGLGKVKAIGYYLFPRKTLFVPQGPEGSDVLHGRHIIGVARSASAILNLADSMKNSYLYRMDELKKGTVEEGEGQEMSSFTYAQERNLLPLDADYNEKDKKAYPYGCSHLVLKNQIR